MDAGSTTTWSQSAKGGLNALYSRLSHQTSRNGIFGPPEPANHRRNKFRDGGVEQVTSPNDGSSSASGAFVPHPFEVGYDMQHRNQEAHMPGDRRSDLRERERAGAEGDSFPGSQRTQLQRSEHPRDVLTGKEIDQHAPSFRPHLPGWLQRAMKHTPQQADGQDIDLGPSNPTALPRRDNDLALPVQSFTATESHAGHAGEGYDTESWDRSERPRGTMLSPPLSAPDDTTALPNEPVVPFASSSASSVAQPFTTPGPHAARRSGIKHSLKTNHDRFVPATVNAVSPLRRRPSITQRDLVAIEPAGFIKPFSTPFVQTQEGLAIKDKYSGNGKRDLYTRSIIGLPTIAEEQPENPYSAASFQDDGFPTSRGDEMPDVITLGQEQETTFTEEQAIPMRLTDPVYLAGQVTKETSPGWQSPSSSGPSFGQSCEMMSDPNSYHDDQTDIHEPWATRTQLLKMTPDAVIFDSGPNRSSLPHHDMQPYYNSNGTDDQELDKMYHLQGPTSTAIMDVDALEAATAAASEESLTAIGVSAEDWNEPELPTVAIAEHKQAVGESVSDD